MLKGQDRYAEKNLQCEIEQNNFSETTVGIYEVVVRSLDRTMGGSGPAAFSTRLPSGQSCLRCRDSKQALFFPLRVTPGINGSISFHNQIMFIPPTKRYVESDRRRHACSHCRSSLCAHLPTSKQYCQQRGTHKSID